MTRRKRVPDVWNQQARGFDYWFIGLTVSFGRDWSALADYCVEMTRVDPDGASDWWGPARQRCEFYLDRKVA